jgi:bifunctional non-homologous end joining protein LigD
MSRTSTLPKRLQPMLATLTDAPFDDPGWVFEDKYDGFRMVAEIRRGKVALYSRNGKIISRSYMEVAKALEGVKGDAVIDGELVAIGKDGVSHFQLLQNALRHEAKLLYCAFDLMFENAADLRKQPLLARKKRLKAILPRNKLIAFVHRKGHGTTFFAEAERKGLEGIMAKRADSAYASGSRTPDWLKIKTAKRQEVVIAGFTAPRRTRPFFGALVLAVREGDAWRCIGHVGTGFSHKVLEDLHAKMPASRGSVIAVAIDAKHRFSKTPRLSVILTTGHGVEGDAHYGQFVRHRYLARRKPRAPNLRQVHLIPSELFDALRKSGFDVSPGDLGENITTAGLDLETLPLNTELHMGASVNIRLTGLRTPCILIDRFKLGLKGQLLGATPNPPFRAGVMAVVSEGGEVSPGDPIRAILPERPHLPLPPL